MNSCLTSTKLRSVGLQEPIAMELSPRVSVILYEDCRPHCMETSALQKGLVLMWDNQELIEEGLGFGVPVAKYLDKTYFSSTAEISIKKHNSTCLLTKVYLLDVISKKVWRDEYIDDRLYSSLRKRFAKFYLSRKELSPLLNRVMELRELAKIRTEFIKVNPRGLIAVNYEIQPDVINISVDFTNLMMNGCEELLVLNEQGSTSFDKYSDTSGLKLVGNKIGGWGAVTARQAFMLSGKGQVAFSLQKMIGATLFRGWEKTRNRFSWAGLSYSLAPNSQTFYYTIRIDY